MAIHFQFRHPSIQASQRTLRAVHHHRPSRRAVITATAQTSSPPEPTANVSLELHKEALLSSVSGTNRGGDATELERGLVEEAMIPLEAQCSGQELEYDSLAGLWRLVYTTAPDVVPIVRPGGGLPGFPVTAEAVYQRFSTPEQGRVQNIIDFTLLAPIVDKTKIRFVVEATYEIRTLRSLALRFQSAGVEKVTLGTDIQNLIAPPILPRGWWNQKILLALEEAPVSVPLSTPSSFLLGRPRNNSSDRQVGGGNYLLTYLDKDMLIGRATTGGGTFVFVKEEDQ